MEDKELQKSCGITFDFGAIMGVVVVYRDIGLAAFGFAACSCVVEAPDNLYIFLKWLSDQVGLV